MPTNSQLRVFAQQQVILNERLKQLLVAIVYERGGTVKIKVSTLKENTKNRVIEFRTDETTQEVVLDLLGEKPSLIIPATTIPRR
jgi:hypothetical protein